MLETIRQYAAGKLREAGEEDELRERHLTWYMRFGEEARERLRGVKQVSWLNRAEKEYENVRSALQWSVAEGRAPERGLTLAGQLQSFWNLRGHCGEGRWWLEKALESCPGAPAPLRVRALNAAGMFSFALGDYERARELHEQCLALERETGDRAAMASTLRTLGDAHLWLGEYERARELLRESLALTLEVGDELGAAAAMAGLGNVSLFLGEIEAGKQWHEKALAIDRRLDSKLTMAVDLHNLGELTHELGDSERALLLEEGLALARELHYDDLAAATLVVMGCMRIDAGDWAGAESLARESLAAFERSGYKIGIAYTLDCLARAAALRGAPVRAVTLAAAATDLRRRMRAAIAPHEHAATERYVGAAAQILGDEAATAARAAGAAMDLPGMIAYALEPDGGLTSSPS
jgi:tetratricopeptide (TPR) repeat protein